MDGSLGACQRWPGLEAPGTTDRLRRGGRPGARSARTRRSRSLTSRRGSSGSWPGPACAPAGSTCRPGTRPPGSCVNENEPLLLGDLLALLERLAPRGAVAYAHDELHRRPDVPADERPNGHAHAKALLLRTAETLNVAAGRLQLGRWQRVLLLDLDGPREREVSLLGMGERRR